MTRINSLVHKLSVVLSNMAPTDRIARFLCVWVILGSSVFHYGYAEDNADVTGISASIASSPQSNIEQRGLEQSNLSEPSNSATDEEQRLRVIAELEGRVINDIEISIRDVFDTDLDEEDGFLFDLTNKLHFETRERTVESQLLFEPGEPMSARALSETERILRAKDYLFNAEVVPRARDDGTVDILVTTKDNWTLIPEWKYSRKSGDTETAYGIEEKNLLGTGTQLNIFRAKDIERESNIFRYVDPNLGQSWVRLDLGYSDLSDGSSNFINVERPFFSLDTLWAGGTQLFADDRILTLYSLGERGAKYRQDQHYSKGYYGFSNGLENNWVRRFEIGYVTNELDFDEAFDDDFISVVPEDRRLNYPYFRYTAIEDRYEETTNFNQIGRVEDVYVGTQFGVGLGYSSEGFAADRNAFILEANYSRNYGSVDNTLVSLGGRFDTRIESGSFQNASLRLSGRYYKRQTEKRVFYSALTARLGHNLDIDNGVVLGGATGLRGYPTNYLNGDSSILATLEQRLYTDYYPFRLFRIGAAVFFDIAQVWGDDVLGENDPGLHADVGFGLRIASTRSSNKRTFHIDIAYPIEADSEIRSVQFQIEGKTSF